MEKISKNQPSMLEGWFLERGNLPGRCPDAEFVAVGVGELGPFAPGFSGELLGNSDPTSFESCAGFFYIVGMQDEASHARVVAATLAAQAEHDMGLCAGKSNFKPALSFAHGLVVYLFKAELVNIKIEGFVLIADAYSDGTDFCEHVYLLMGYLPPAAAEKRGACGDTAHPASGLCPLDSVLLYPFDSPCFVDSCE
jgi:hypothetical protein